MDDEKKLTYVEIKPLTRAQFSKELASGDEQRICQALYSAAQHDPDWRWAQEQCLAMLKHKAMVVRSAAIMAIGEIAIFRHKIDAHIVVPELQFLLSDSALAPFAQDALDDITSLMTGGKSIN